MISLKDWLTDDFYKGLKLEMPDIYNELFADYQLMTLITKARYGHRQVVTYEDIDNETASKLVALQYKRKWTDLIERTDNKGGKITKITNNKDTNNKRERIKNEDNYITTDDNLKISTDGINNDENISDVYNQNETKTKEDIDYTATYSTELTNIAVYDIIKLLTISIN